MYPHQGNADRWLAEKVPKTPDSVDFSSAVQGDGRKYPRVLFASLIIQNANYGIKQTTHYSIFLSKLSKGIWK